MIISSKVLLNMPEPSKSTMLYLYIWGFSIRLIFLKSSSLADALGSRVEISTPITSWKKAVEGVNLWKQGTNPYDSDIFHESPLGLVTYNYFLTHIPQWLPVIFAICDIVTATALSFAAKIYLNSCVKKEKSERVPESAELLLLKPEKIVWIPFYVAAVYLLGPYSVVSCGGKSTVTFQNMLLSVFLLFTVSSKWFLAAVALAVLSCHSFYHITLLVPLAMHVYQTSDCDQKKIWKTVKLLATIITCFATVILLMLAFRKITGSWHFLWCTYGCILSVPDLTPNIGLFWYFFTEMFEHFRVFFLCTFQLNVFVYTTPLAVRLRKEPIFFLFIHLIIITIFKSYPCIGDVAFYLSLLPVWSHLFHFMRQRFIVCCVLASCTLLAPTLWHLWIYSGSANANFYFAITLAFNTGQVFLLTDILSAYIKREYYLEKGVKYNEDGSLVLMRLQ